MSKAIWINGKGEAMLLNVFGQSTMHQGYLMVQKSTAQPGHGLFSVHQSKLVLL